MKIQNILILTPGDLKGENHNIKCPTLEEFPHIQGIYNMFDRIEYHYGMNNIVILWDSSNISKGWFQWKGERIEEEKVNLWDNK